MPKRLKKGKPPGEQKFRGACRSCKAEWEYVRSELQSVQFDQREGGELASVTCPDCQSQFWVYPVKQ